MTALLFILAVVLLVAGFVMFNSRHGFWLFGAAMIVGFATIIASNVDFDKACAAKQGVSVFTEHSRLCLVNGIPVRVE